MGRIRITFASGQIFRSDFAAEWFGVGVIALVAALWARYIGFGLAIQWGDFLFPCLVIFASLTAHALMSKRASLVTEYFLLTIAATAVFGVVSYLSMATGRPLADHALMAADRAIGFDWMTDYRWLLHHAVAAKILQFAYNSLVYQGLYFGVLFAVMGKRANLREMFWLVLIAGLLTSVGAALFPALGPFKSFGIKAEFLPDMERLRSGELHFALAKLTGVVSFPSFHTTMALLYIYGFSRAGVIGWVAVLLNVAMLPAIPFFGGHYLVDMFAGAAVALVSVGVVRSWPAISSSIALPGDDALIKVRGQLSHG
jgi:hypothetical protein